MQDFDIAGAREVGYSDGEIATFLSKKANFDYKGARNAGYSDSKILESLSQGVRQPTPPVKAEVPPVETAIAPPFAPTQPDIPLAKAPGVGGFEPTGGVAMPPGKGVFETVIQPVQRAVTAAKEYLPSKIVESNIGSANVRAGLATAAKLTADIGEWVLLPSGKLKFAGKVVAKAAEKLGGKAFAKAAEQAAMRLPATTVKGAGFGALEEAETLGETFKNAAEMGVFTALLEAGIGTVLAVNTVKKLAANTKAAGGKLPDTPKTQAVAAQEVKARMEGQLVEPVGDTGVIKVAQPPIEGLKPEPVSPAKLEALQAKLGKPKPQKPKGVKDAVKEGVQPEGLGDIPVAEAPKLPKGEKAININLDNLETTADVKNLIKQTSEVFKGEINVQRRGKITHQETQELADSLGMTPEKLLKARKGKAFNAEEAKASRDVLVQSADDTSTLAEKYMKDMSDETLAKFTTSLARHVEIQKTVSGITAEAGRALSQFRIKAKAGQSGLQKAKQLESVIESFGGKDKAQFIAEKLSRMSEMSTADRARFLSDATKATTMDKLFEAWVNGLLSSLTTHAVNITSNTFTFLSKFPERAIGTTLDLFKASATGTARQRFYGEAPYQIYGGWQGLKEGVRKGIYAFKNEVSPEMATRFDVQRYQAISGKKGKIIRIPGRALIAADEFFKAINYQSELHGLAYRKAAREGKKGVARTKRIAQILSDPASEMKEAAQGEMFYRVFQKDLGKVGKGVQALRGKSSALKFLIPFLRTPINIAKFGLERTPLNAPLVMKKALKGELKGSQITDEAAKVIMGSMIGAAVYTYVKEGSMSGWGPTKPAERAAMYRTNWQPYSIKIGDEYYSYFRLEPLGMIFGLAADFAELKDQMNADELEDLPALVALAIGRNITNKTFMRGLSDALNAMSDPERYGKSWVKNFGATLVIPRGVASVARALDPEMRQTGNFIDYLKSQIPGLSETLFPRRDIWGKTIVRGGTTATRLFSPVRVSAGKQDDDIINNEMVRLGIYIGKLKNSIKGVKLTPKEFDDYQKLAGEKAREQVDRYVSLSYYEKIDDERKAKVIRRMVMSARSMARKRIYRAIPSERKKQR